MKVTAIRSFYGQEGQVKVGQVLEIKPTRATDLIKKRLVAEKQAPTPKNKKAPEPDNKGGQGAA